MLTSSANQYLRPEYLTPLPTTLDAKKSPLALLAQTCSQIGVDPPSSKSLLAPLEKSSGKSSKTPSEQTSREKSSPQSSGTSATHENTKSSFKPYESCILREKAASPEEQRVASVHSSSGRSRTPGNGSKRCSSNQSASSGRAVTPQGRKSSTPNGDITRESPASRVTASSSVAETNTSHANSPSSQSKQTYSPANVLNMTDLSMKDLPLGTFRPGMALTSSSSSSSPSPSTVTTSAYLGYPPQLPVDVMTNSLMSQHHALKNGLASHPYLSYARMKTATGAEAIVPVCRDPYCTGCQLNSHLLASSAVAGKIPTTSAGACPAGCAQCDHKSSSPYGPLGANAAAYAHAQLAALAAASQLPYGCNWVGGDTAFCGKRFGTSDELLQHLRNHTNVGTSDANAAATAAAALSLLSPSGLPAGHPLLSRNYPTPPLSPLAAGRYHPYGKPIMSPLTSLGLPMPSPHPHPAAAGLPPYFSPYTLYAGSRLGATSGMHP